MIKINLLPVPKAHKHRAVIAEGLIAIGVLAVACIVGLTVSAQKEKSIRDIEAQNRQIQAEIQKLQAQVGEVDRYKKKLRSLQDQLDIINKLQAGRSGPVRMMDELTDLVPRKLWLTSFKEANRAVTIQGTATDGPVIADFLESLKKAKFFENAELQTVQAQEQDGVPLQKFTIVLNVKYDG